MFILCVRQLVEDSLVAAVTIDNNSPTQAQGRVRRGSKALLLVLRVLP